MVVITIVVLSSHILVDVGKLLVSAKKPWQTTSSIQRLSTSALDPALDRAITRHVIRCICCAERH